MTANGYRGGFFCVCGSEGGGMKNILKLTEVTVVQFSIFASCSKFCIIKI